tara:strand:- start:5964 stop:6923 length:960 start_codon:yes stop_codon:yes gene_type:complete
MEQRKLIKFGNSSFVISIPNAWIKKNNLEKGHSVFLKENGENQIIVSPTVIEKKREIKRVTINVTGKSIDSLQREIIAAYIQDYSVIKLTGKDLKEKEQEIRNIIHNLTGLEIIEQTGERIIAKDFLDLEDSSIMNLVKRIDISIRSMFEDVKKVKTKQDHQSILLRKEEVNKLWFLVSRATKYYLSMPGSQKTTNMTTLEIFNFWDLMHHIKRIGVELRKLSEGFLKVKEEKEDLEKIMVVYDRLKINYEDMMKSYYTKDKLLAFKVSPEKKEILAECNQLYEEYWNKENFPQIIEILRNTAIYIHDIGRVVHSYGPN